MATFNDDSHMALKECPYNPDHKVAPTKYPLHVAKCARSFETPMLKTCIYHAGHRLPPNQYYKHLETCSYKSVGNAKPLDQEKERRMNKPLTTKVLETQEEEENWTF